VESPAQLGDPGRRLNGYQRLQGTSPRTALADVTLCDRCAGGPPPSTTGDQAIYKSGEPWGQDVSNAESANGSSVNYSTAAIVIVPELMWPSASVSQRACILSVSRR
jgi:hypothetical protein